MQTILKTHRTSGISESRKTIRVTVRTTAMAAIRVTKVTIRITMRAIAVELAACAKTA